MQIEHLKQVQAGLKMATENACAAIQRLITLTECLQADLPSRIGDVTPTIQTQVLVNTVSLATTKSAPTKPQGELGEANEKLTNIANIELMRKVIRGYSKDKLFGIADFWIELRRAGAMFPRKRVNDFLAREVARGHLVKKGSGRQARYQRHSVSENFAEFRAEIDSKKAPQHD